MMSDNEQENEKRDSVTDILAEWRECIKAADPSVWDDARIAGLVKTTKAQQLAYLDRIEAAWEREREELDKRISDLEAYAKLWTGRADELRLKCDEFYAKAKPVGNAAAMREALENCANMGEQIDYQLGSSDETVFALRHERCLAHNISECARAALSAPARNCDLFDNWYDAHQAWERLPKDEPGYFVAANGVHECEQAWLFAPAADREGEN